MYIQAKIQMHSNDKPLVSIIVNAYKRNDTLPKAIESALDQSYPNTEIIVVDDSGEGYSKPVVSQYDVKYIELKETQGLTGARTAGVKKSNGEYIQLLDDDDWLYKNKISKQVERFQECDSLGLVYCGFKTSLGQEVFPDPAVKDNTLKRALTFQMRACKPSTALIRREELEAILPGDESLWLAEDLWMWIELAESADFDFVDELLISRGIGDDQMVNNVDVYKTMLKIITRYDELYDNYPKSVRNQAIGTTYFRMGRVLLHAKPWSGLAIITFAKSLFYLPEPTAKHYGYAFSSLFGKPGYKFAAWLYRLKT